MSVRGTLDRLGWTRGSVSDHGVIQEFFKHFPAADATALLEVEPGIPIGNRRLVGGPEGDARFLPGRVV